MGRRKKMIFVNSYPRFGATGNALPVLQKGHTPVLDVERRSLDDMIKVLEILSHGRYAPLVRQRVLETNERGP